MATIRFYQPVDMLNAYVWYGTVTVANSTTISITDYWGTTGTYTGHGITYNGDNVVGGVITGYTQNRNYMLDYTISDTSLPAPFVAEKVQSGQMYELQAAVLAGNDDIYGSSRADTLLGHSGDDYILASGGNDYVDGGTGIDTAFFRGNSSEYNIQRGYGLVTVTDTAHGRDGTDHYSRVEIFQFADRSLTLPQYDSVAHPDAVYRFFNTSTGAHFYTSSTSEADSVSRSFEQFSYDGVSFSTNTDQSGDVVDIFRFFNTDNGTHFFTASEVERDGIIANLPMYQYEGVAYQAHGSKDPGTTELYRFYNTESGSHFYTASATEMEDVKIKLAGTFQYEGVAYYVDV